MKSKLEWALHHAKNGFFVFRIVEDGKTPKYKGWQAEATRDEGTVRELWSGRDRNCNVGVFTGKFSDDRALIVVDVDNKNDKDGDATILDLELDGYPLHVTYENITASGGRHMVYWSEKAVKQGAQVLGEGLDIRSRGGYIVMAGSTIGKKTYVAKQGPVEKAPAWLYSKLLLATNVAPKMEVHSDRIDPERARERALKYLDTAEVPSAGTRNDTLYKVACELKDRGVDENVCLELITGWNEGFDDPLEEAEIENTVRSAYEHSQNSAGFKAPEAAFEPIEKKETKKSKDPVLTLNDEYALTLAGGGHHILWETTDEKGNFKLEHLNEQSFHKMLAYAQIQYGDGTSAQISKAWVSHPDARRYDGLTFAPGTKVDPRFYNMWRGFAYEPMKAGEVIPDEWKRSLDQFLEHAFVNVCGGDEKLFRYLIGFYAHMIQRPWEKPLVALTFKGEKGTGKNALNERIAALINPHFTIADDKRYLTGNFNGHLESCLMLILDEAFWSGDKDAEGRLKSLITGQFHNIELKGKEPYKVPNLTRTVIIGNETWLVPASFDERRFGVFNVGNGRKQDREFFYTMRKRMEAGGYRLLLTYLLEYDLSDIDVNNAPVTKGLIEQKHASLEPFEQWWLDCLSEGELLGTMAKGISFEEIHVDTFRNAFMEYARRRSIRARLPDERGMQTVLGRIAPSMTKIRTRVGGALGFIYKSDGLEQLRRDWEKFIGAKIEWPVYDNENEGDIECLK